MSETGTPEATPTTAGQINEYQSRAMHRTKGLDSTPAAQHGSDASGETGVGQRLVDHGQGSLPAPEPWAGVDAAVQATPIQHRVPVQAVRLSPASPDHKVSACAQMTLVRT